MRKRIRVILSATLVTAICTGVIAFAITGQQTIKVSYNNIKLMIDGKEFVPKDAQGKVVEPFIFNGTTYLPVRGVANAFGKDINWSPETMTVSLGTNQAVYLDSLGYVDLKSNSNDNKFTLFSNDNIKHGLKFYQYGNIEPDGKASQTITYKLNGLYKKFAATLHGDGGEGTIMKIYGDGQKLLYAAPAVNSDSQQIELNIDISNQTVLYFECTNVTRYGNSAILSEARLLK